MTAIHAETRPEAFKQISKIIGGKAYTNDKSKSDRAGYNIYTFEGGWISDMISKVEVNYDSGETITVFVDEVSPNDSLKGDELLFRVFTVNGSETIMKYATISEVRDFLIKAGHEAYKYGYAPQCTWAEYQANIRKAG